MRLTTSVVASGGGASYTEVANYAALPAAAGATGDIYVVLAGSGVWFINRNPPGLYRSNGASWTLIADIPEDYFNDDIQTKCFGITIDGGGVAITTGVKGYVEIPYDCVITGWTVIGDVSGAIVIDVWKDTYANALPTVADTIAGTEKPTITASGIKGQDLALSSWTTTITAGDIIGFNVDSCTAITRAMLVIRTSVA